MHIHDVELSTDGRLVIAVGHQEGAMIDLFQA
jgi:hypothetical protein